MMVEGRERVTGQLGLSVQKGPGCASLPSRHGHVHQQQIPRLRNSALHSSQWLDANRMCLLSQNSILLSYRKLCTNLVQTLGLMLRNYYQGILSYHIQRPFSLLKCAQAPESFSTNSDPTFLVMPGILQASQKGSLAGNVGLVGYVPYELD